MTNQEIFDKVARHLLTQNERAATGPDMIVDKCKYRQGKLKCAVGCLIPDDRYDRRMEDKSVVDLLGGWPDCIPGVGAENQETIYFLSDLQKVHDWSEVHEWRERLRALAKIRGLSAEVLNETPTK